MSEVWPFPYASLPTDQSCSSTSPHTSSANPHNCTLVSKTSLLFYDYSSSGGKTPSSSTLWLYSTPLNLMFSSSSSGTFHTLLFLPVGLSLHKATIYCRSPTITKSRTPQAQVYHHTNPSSVKHWGWCLYTQQCSAPCRHPETLHNPKLAAQHLTGDCSWSNLSAFGGQGG